MTMVELLSDGLRGGVGEPLQFSTSDVAGGRTTPFVVALSSYNTA